MKSYSTIVNDAEALLQDSSNGVFLVTEFDTIMPQGLILISRCNPWRYKATKTTTASSYDITLSSGDKWRLLDGTGYKGTGIAYAEYKVDQNPRQFRGLTRFGDTLSLELMSRPSSAVPVYLYMNKIHLLQKEIGTDDTAGEIKTDADAGDTSIVLDSLGTGTINEMTTLTIDGDSTTYYVIETATIDTNEATVSIWPPLASAVTAGTVVALSLTDSTLNMMEEDLLARWLAAQAAISKATVYYQQVNTCITTLASAVTAISAVAARITQAITDAASIRISASAGSTAIALGNAEFDKMATEVALGKTALASGASLINTIPVGGGAAEYMGQAAADVGIAHGYLSTGQSYLQEASADNANANDYAQAASAELRAASEKISEGITNLRLVSTRLQVSDGGRQYERWGREELARVMTDLRKYGGLPIAKRYPQD